MSNDSIFIKALGVKYKELSSYEVTREVEKLFESHGCPLGPYQKEVLNSDWAGEYGMLPFEAYEWVGMKNKQDNILCRLSAIPLVIWLLLLILSIPFKWILTGVPYYKTNPNKKSIGTFTINWIDKCFDRE